MENENTNPAEEKDKKPEQDTPSESAENAAEGTPEQTEETTPDTAEEAAEGEPEQSEETSGESAELEALRSENLRLKAQLEAHKTGFKGEFIEDAVCLAEFAAKRDGITISEALQALAKKYPAWKHASGDAGKSGFKVGAQLPKEEKSADDDRLDEAFGIRRKK